LQDASFTELEANLTVNYQGIITAQEQILKIKKQIDRYKEMYSMKEGGAEKQQSYQNYLNKLAEQQSILAKLIDLTFFTDGVCDDNLDIWDHDCFIQDGIRSDMTPMEFFDHIVDLEESKKYWID
jgi:septation ring formation regulator EzrA